MKTALGVNILGALCVAALTAAAPLDSLVIVDALRAVEISDSPVADAALRGIDVFDSPVADAAQRGELETVRSLLRAGADVNAAQGDGMTALHWAAERGHEELVEVLVYAGAYLEALTRLGDYTPLHLASKGAHAPVVTRLLAAGADVMARTTGGGLTPLHFAASSGNRMAVLALVSAGADVDARESAFDQTPLMFAAASNRMEAIEALLAEGADPSLTARVIDIPARDAEDRRASAGRNRRMATLRAVEDPGSFGPGGAFERGGVGRESQPARGGRAEAPASGRAPTGSSAQRTTSEPRPLAFTDLVGTYGGLTALLLAARDGQVEAALALLEGGVDLDQPSAGDRTPALLMAVVNGHFDLAMLLVERGADVTLTSDAGNTPLYAAINTQWIPKSRHPQPTDYQQQQTDYLQLMEALLEAGADVNARLSYQLWFTEYGREFLGVDRMGATPFWRAAHATDVAAMTLLAAYGADPGIPTRKPRSRRAQTYRPEQALDPSGLAPIPPGGPGVYPIHAASGVGYGEGYAGNVHRHVPDGWLPAVKYLVEVHGADVNARDDSGYTAVHHAAARGDNELILYLVEKGADVMAVARTGQTTVDLANGPVQRISPFPETIALLESLGAINNHRCVSC